MQRRLPLGEYLGPDECKAPENEMLVLNVVNGYRQPQLLRNENGTAFDQLSNIEERTKLLRELGPRMRSLQRARDNDAKMRERRARGQSYVSTTQDRKATQEQLFPNKKNGFKSEAFLPELANLDVPLDKIADVTSDGLTKFLSLVSSSDAPPLRALWVIKAILPRAQRGQKPSDVFFGALFETLVKGGPNRVALLSGDMAGKEPQLAYLQILVALMLDEGLLAAHGLFAAARDSGAVGPVRKALFTFMRPFLPLLLDDAPGEFAALCRALGEPSAGAALFPLHASKMLNGGSNGTLANGIVSSVLPSLPHIESLSGVRAVVCCLVKRHMAAHLVAGVLASGGGSAGDGVDLQGLLQRLKDANRALFQDMRQESLLWPAVCGVLDWALGELRQRAQLAERRLVLYVASELLRLMREDGERAHHDVRAWLREGLCNGVCRFALGDPSSAHVVALVSECVAAGVLSFATIVRWMTVTVLSAYDVQAVCTLLSQLWCESSALVDRASYLANGGMADVAIAADAVAAASAALLHYVVAEEGSAAPLDDVLRDVPPFVVSQCMPSLVKHVERETTAPRADRASRWMDVASALPAGERLAVALAVALLDAHGGGADAALLSILSRAYGHARLLGALAAASVLSRAALLTAALRDMVAALRGAVIGAASGAATVDASSHAALCASVARAGLAPVQQHLLARGQWDPLLLGRGTPLAIAYRGSARHRVPPVLQLRASAPAPQCSQPLPTDDVPALCAWFSEQASALDALHSLDEHAHAHYVRGVVVDFLCSDAAHAVEVPLSLVRWACYMVGNAEGGLSTRLLSAIGAFLSADAPGDDCEERFLEPRCFALSLSVDPRRVDDAQALLAVSMHPRLHAAPAALRWQCEALARFTRSRSALVDLLTQQHGVLESAEGVRLTHLLGVSLGALVNAKDELFDSVFVANAARPPELQDRRQWALFEGRGLGIVKGPWSNPAAFVSGWTPVSGEGLIVFPRVMHAIVDDDDDDDDGDADGRDNGGESRLKRSRPE